MKKLIKKGLLYLLVSIVAMVLFFVVTESSPEGFGLKKDLIEFDPPRTYYLPEEALKSGQDLLGSKIQVRGIIGYKLQNPNLLGTNYTIGDLPLKIEKGEISWWYDYVNQEKKVEGIMAAKVVEDKTYGTQKTLYYLENPVVRD